jgi:hypothetical protein
MFLIRMFLIRMFLIRMFLIRMFLIRKIPSLPVSKISNFLTFRCNDLLKNRDDSPSFLVTRLTAIRVLGTMYERLGRMTGRSYEETVQVLSKGLKNAESQSRAETMIAFGKTKINMFKLM